ncbi:PIN domain-containing protein [Candidatus Saccharibacteria bacterium]|nr:PIN domain-containing protein [Candidatus Saccharibacteria bacterium]
MICLDANVLIEIVLGRKNAEVCQAYLDSAREDLAITLLSLDLAMYYAEAHKLAFQPIEQFMRLFIWLPMIDADAQWAFEHFAGKDYEDALQVAAASREGCSRFVTLDRNLAKKYPKNIAIDLLA